MKTKVFLLALMAFPVIVMGQEPTEYTPEIKVTPPAFTGVENIVEIFDNGNMPSIENYLANRIRFDKISREFIEQVSKNT